MELQLLSKKQLLKILGISQPTLDKEVKAGKIPVIRIGRRVLFSKDEVNKYITGKFETDEKNN